MNNIEVKTLKEYFSMSKNKLFIIVSLFVLVCILFGFFALTGDDPTTAVSFSTITPVEQTTTGDYLGTWSAGTPIPFPGSYGGAGVGYTNVTGDTSWLYSINGDVDGAGTAPGQFRRYNMRTNVWTTLPNYPSGRAWTSAGIIGPESNPTLYVVGGLPSGAATWAQMTGSLQRYNINTNTWSTLTSAQFPTGSPGVYGYKDTFLFVIGGIGANGQPMSNVQFYNRFTNLWGSATPLPSARANGWMVIKSDTIYYGCGAGPTTSTFNNNIFVGVIDGSALTWSISPVTYPGTNRHRMDADLFGCFGIFIGPGALSIWWGTGNEAYIWNGGNSAFVNVGPIPTPTSDAQVGAGYFQRRNYKIWKAVVATGLVMISPYHILNTQVYTDSCYIPPYSGWCEGFTAVTFPPTGWTLSGAALLWSRALVSAYGVGVGSAKADFYNVPTGSQQLFSQSFTPFQYPKIEFKNAYCTYTTENDKLQILASTNSGSTWTLVITLNGGVSGQLVTAPPQTTAFTPTPVQWKNQTIVLSSMTNKVQFNAITA